jgi:hypothetical protein
LIISDSDYYDDGKPWGFPWISDELHIEADKNISVDSVENAAVVSGDSRPDWLQVL